MKKIILLLLICSAIIMFVGCNTQSSLPADDPSGLYFMNSDYRKLSSAQGYEYKRVEGTSGIIGKFEYTNIYVDEVFYTYRSYEFRKDGSYELYDHYKNFRDNNVGCEFETVERGSYRLYKNRNGYFVVDLIHDEYLHNYKAYYVDDDVLTFW